MVAECLGSLALLNGRLVLPALQAQLVSPSGAGIGTRAGGLRSLLVVWVVWAVDAAHSCRCKF